MLMGGKFLIDSWTTSINISAYLSPLNLLVDELSSRMLKFRYIVNHILQNYIIDSGEILQYLMMSNSIWDNIYIER